MHKKSLYTNNMHTNNSHKKPSHKHYENKYFAANNKHKAEIYDHCIYALVIIKKFLNYIKKNFLAYIKNG